MELGERGGYEREDDAGFMILCFGWVSLELAGNET
jgi:hypothetical protein